MAEKKTLPPSEEAWVKDLTEAANAAASTITWPKNQPNFDDYSQSLAGNLVAQVEALNRVQADLNTQRVEAIQKRDRIMAKAEEEYETQARALDEKTADAKRATAAIEAALKVLSP